ncbi:MAG TPA: helix-turn-helix domain-containing protein [Myxococcota bacterium]
MSEKHRDSRTSILKAAVVEFAKHGLSGARIEHIAARSGFNKALIYRHFGTREALFDDTLAFKFEQKLAVHEAAPQNLGDTLVYWFDTAAKDPRFLQLLMREALDDDGDALAHEAFRQDYYARQRKDLERWRDDGQLDPALPIDALLLLLSGLVSFPSFFPTLTRLICGTDTEATRDQWRRLLRELARRLAPPKDPSQPAGEGGAETSRSS